MGGLTAHSERRDKIPFTLHLGIILGGNIFAFDALFLYGDIGLLFGHA